MSALRILLIEDSSTDAKLLMRELRKVGEEVEFDRVQDGGAMRSALKEKSWDAIISDWSMPRFSALEALAVLQKSGLDLPFIIASGTIGEESAVEAMRAGAHDYVLKDKLARLAPAVEREIRDCKLRETHRQQEARFRALIEKSAEAVVVSGADGKWTYASPAAGPIFGRPPAELMATSTFDFVHPEDWKFVVNEIGRLATDASKTLALEFRIVRPDGSVRWLAASCRNLLADPAVRGLVANFRDVTDQKVATEALRTSEARFAHLAKSGIIGVLTVDMHGAILEANDTYLKMIGHTREELSSGAINWGNLVHPDYAEATTRSLEQLGVHGVTTCWETGAMTKDGRRVPMLVGAAMLDESTCIAFCADLTERKRTEEALRKTEEHLRQAQKMEAVGRLAGGVAHDFNNVLSVILSYGEFMMSDLKVGDPMRDDVQEINKAAKRAADLTRQLLMFSRQQVLDPRALDLNEVLTGLEKMLPRLVGEDIEIVILRAQPLGMLKADPSSIDQVIMNLVVNARDAMPTGGTLTLETGNVVLDEDHARRHGTKPGPHVMLAVTDSGIGMDEATQSRIFEPFFTTKAKDKGTGLGLSTVFGIVTQSGGSICVESEVGEGTTFKIYLPREKGNVEHARPLGTSSAVRGTETILLVEDEDQVRVVARGILKRHGYHIVEARNAGEALLLCEKDRSLIHLLLTDVVMPQMSGPELAKRLVALRPDMRVLFMSGYTDDSIVRHGILNANIAYLQKPLTPALLTRKVRDVLDAP